MLYILSKEESIEEKRRKYKKWKPFEELPKYKQQLFFDYLPDSKAMIRSFYLEDWTQSEINILAEETLLRAVKQYDKKKGKFSTYLYRALKSAAQDVYQKKEKQAPIIKSLDEELPGLSGEEIALKDVLEDIDALRMEDYIEYLVINKELKDVLTEQEKIVINMIGDGYTLREIGTEMKLSTPRIHIILNKAREKAKKILDIE